MTLMQLLACAGMITGAFLLSRKLRKSAKIVYNGLEIKNHITKERM